MSELALTEEIKTLGLEKYAEQLERDGLTIVPPEVNGFGVDRIDEIVELILARAREMTTPPTHALIRLSFSLLRRARD